MLKTINQFSPNPIIKYNEFAQGGEKCNICVRQLVQLVTYSTCSMTRYIFFSYLFKGKFWGSEQFVQYVYDHLAPSYII